MTDTIHFSDKTDAPRAAGNHWTILVVDDDHDMHQATRLALTDVRIQNRPIELVDAFSGTEAGKIMETRDDIDLILLDVVMENENAGFDCARHIRTVLKKKPPVIIVRTGFAGNDFEKNPRALREGIIDNFIKKSMTTRDLLISILSKYLH